MAAFVFRKIRHHGDDDFACFFTTFFGALPRQFGNQLVEQLGRRLTTRRVID
jgi:hypothetical protein